MLKCLQHFFIISRIHSGSGVSKTQTPGRVATEATAKLVTQCQMVINYFCLCNSCHDRWVRIFDTSRYSVEAFEQRNSSFLRACRLLYCSYLRRPEDLIAQS
ncbi:hypothetical protein L873DRAFT_256847 [Choiromyces venosus 120613-1]|uniref:Uncharacterized protein n=1 Tax=Choiromyces venosus 120613-1 TaxID=1336337 RepID=A0A3N4J4B6_9PEZI|nr:hypothetical protein L873DRAFT_256847 [Choiromyces venosus 120613-1]